MKTIAECWEDARWNGLEKVNTDKPAAVRVIARIGTTAVLYGTSYRRHESWRAWPMLEDIADNVDEEQLFERYQQWCVEEQEKLNPKA